ncbi:restriction endonuclease subunit S [Aeromonas veronii]|uniref:restriction endonuclease subunit S n=1 Tax=Aeromonas veronii TaxID=654 RepID=UPI00301CFE6B
MCSEWPLIPLRDFVDLLAGFAFKSTGYSDGQDDVRLLRGDNIAPGRVRWDGVKRWSRENAVGLERYALEPGDVVLAMDRPWIPAGLKVAQVQAADTPSYLVQRVARIRPASREDCSFLFALLSTPEFESYIQNVTTGTAVPHISAKQILDFEFRLPPAYVRAKVGEIVAALNERITLLRETNTTLEAMAQTLFKWWFVDFDPVHARARGEQPAGLAPEVAALFPDCFEESALGMIPKGWGVQLIRDVVEGVYDGPHATPPESDVGPVFLGIKNLTGTALALSDVRHIADEDFIKWTKRVTPKAGDIVFSYEATLGFFALIPDEVKCCLGRRLALIRPMEIDGHGHFWFHQFVAAPFQRHLEKHTIQGATVNRIALKEFPGYPVLNPSSELKQAFEVRAAAIWHKIHLNQKQAQTLANLRDTLLPRLISGQLRLPEGDAVLQDAGI